MGNQVKNLLPTNSALFKFKCTNNEDTLYNLHVYYIEGIYCLAFSNVWAGNRDQCGYSDKYYLP